MVPPDTADAKAVEELLRTIGKAQRALQMYLPNNPVYKRSLAQLADAFAPVWSVTGRLVLDIHEHDVHWEGISVTPESARGEGFAWQLYKDGLRRLTLLPGVEGEEIQRFLELLNRARLLPADASDDLLTLLWEEELVLITYAFIEALGDGMEFLQESPIRETNPEPGTARAEVAEADRHELMAELADADSTPYFLDEAEGRFIRSELDEEYRRDIGTAAMDALMDILETVNDAEVRREIIGLLEDVLPAQLAVGGFGAVAHILRELRVIIARVTGLDQDMHAAVLSFEERLSDPAILEQLFRVLDDGTVRGNEADVAAVLRELKPQALPAILAHLGTSLDPGVQRALAASVDDLARARPALLSAVLHDGPAEAQVPALEVVARLKQQQLVPAVIAHSREGSLDLRLAAVRALAALATPTAIDAIESAIEDPDRTVRQAALTALQDRGGSGGAQKRLERLLFSDRSREFERSERRQLYEAFAQFGGADSLPRLREVLEPRGLFRRAAPSEDRACAIYALARIGSFEARMVVDRCTSDKDPVVRSAANSVLREWIG